MSTTSTASSPSTTKETALTNKEARVLVTAIALVDFWASSKPGVDEHHYSQKLELELDLATAVDAYRLAGS